MSKIFLNSKCREMIGMALGQASMAWTETPKGVFDSSRAASINNDLIKNLENEIEAEATRRQFEPKAADLNKTMDCPPNINRAAINWAERLIMQLPKELEARNSWLLHHGITKEAAEIRDSYNRNREPSLHVKTPIYE